MQKCLSMIFGLACMSAPAAAQDIPNMLAQCGGVYEALYEFQPPEGNHGHIGQAAQIFRNRASVEADGPSGVTEANALYEETLATWLGRGEEVAMTEEFADWMVRCREFATDVDLDLGL